MRLSLLALFLLAVRSFGFDYPVKIRSVITRMTSCTQKALKNACSRMEIELPPAVDFGVESGKKMSAEKGSMSDKIKRSNREAARLFTDMFAQIQSTSVVLFPSEEEAADARNGWPTYRGQCLSIDVDKTKKGYGKLRSRRFSAQEQESALMATDGIYVPEGTELLIIAGPRVKDYRKIRKISEKLGEGTCIILLNGRADAANALSSSTEEAAAEESQDDEGKNSSPSEWLTENYVSVFNYAPPALGKETVAKMAAAGFKEERDLLLYHEYGDCWYLGEKDPNSNKGILGLGGSNKVFNTLFKTEDDKRPTQADLAKVLSVAAAPVAKS